MVRNDAKYLHIILAVIKQLIFLIKEGNVLKTWTFVIRLPPRLHLCFELLSYKIPRPSSFEEIGKFLENLILDVRPNSLIFLTLADNGRTIGFYLFTEHVHFNIVSFYILDRIHFSGKTGKPLNDFFEHAIWSKATNLTDQRIYVG